MKLLQSKSKEELIEIIYELKVLNFKNIKDLEDLRDENYLLEKENLLLEEALDSKNKTIFELNSKPQKVGLFKRFLSFLKSFL